MRVLCCRPSKMHPSAPFSAIVTATRRFARQYASLLLLGPGLLFSMMFFFTPIAVMLGYSLSETKDGEAYFSLAHYIEIVTDEYYWAVLLRTIRVSLITTVCALALGYPAALYLYFSASRWRRVFLFVVVSPLFVSVIVRTYGWIVILSPSGVLASVFGDLKLLHTEGAIIVGLMHIYLPFMILALNSAMYKIDRRLLHAAASLGAWNWRIFRDILLPPSVPGILAGCIFVFSISMTAFSTPVLLGGAKNKTLPFLVYQQNILLANWHLGSAIAFLLLCVTLVIVGVLTKASRAGRLGAASEGT